MLNINSRFRPEKDLCAVYRRAKGHAFLADLTHLAKAKYLEAAGVGEDRPLPANKIMQVAVHVDRLGSRAQHEMKRVAK